MPIRRALPVLVLLALPALPAGAAGPSAPPPCGTVVTESVRLAGTMTCPVGDALIAGADGIVLDLRDLTIQGAGAYSGSGAGVRVPQRHDVLVLGGTIRGMGTGVVLDQGSDHHVSKVLVEQADRGIQVSNSADALVEKNRSVGNGRDGILISGFGSTGARVVQNRLADNVFGIFVTDGPRGTLVAQNTVERTRGSGIATYAAASDTRILRNTVTGGGGDGVEVQPSAEDVLIVQNTLSRNAGDGLQNDLPGATVTANRADDNGELGIEAVPGTRDGGGNRASGNGDPRQCTGVECR